MQRVLDPVLPPLVRAAAAGRMDEALSIRLLDPAMGDGAFLAAAADRIAAALAPAAGRPRSAVRRMVLARCVHGVDIDPAAVELSRRALGAGSGAARLALGDALDPDGPLGRTGAYDLILGNPPWGGWNRTLTPEVKRVYRERFSTARGLLDPSVLFVERCGSLLAPGGRLGLVLPDYLLLKNYPALRRHLLERYRLDEMIHWGRVFEGVNLDAFTLVAVRAADRPPGHRVSCLPEGPSGRVVRIPQTRFQRNDGHRFNLSLDGPTSGLLSRLRKTGAPLGDWLEMHEGIHSGNIRRKLFIPPGARAPRGAKPLILGRGELRPFRLWWAGGHVVPDPARIRRARGEYANLGERRWFRADKILIRRTGDRVLAAVDPRGLYASNNLFVALRKPGCPVPLAFLEGYLNSILATWCFRAIQPRAGRLFAELKLNHLRRLPVPRPSSRQQVARVVRLVRRLRREAASGGGPSAVGLAELDGIFSEMGGLTRAERRRVESRLPRGPVSL